MTFNDSTHQTTDTPATPPASDPPASEGAVAAVTDSGAGVAQATTPAATPTPPQPTLPELKIVILAKDNHVLIGVGSPGCDPVSETVNGDLFEILRPGVVLNTVQVALRRWDTAKLNPKAVAPPPPPAVPATTKPPTSKPASKPPAPAAKKDERPAPPMPRFF